MNPYIQLDKKEAECCKGSQNRLNQQFLKMTNQKVVCVDCKKEGVVERKRCKECVLIYNRLRQQKRYYEKGRHHFDKICLYCNKPLKAWNRTQNYHLDCYKNQLNIIAPEAYKPSTNNYHARKKAKELGLELDNKHCVHHIDENPENNSLDNLMYMTKKDHNALHGYLRFHRSLWLKDQSQYSENCWDTLRDRLTTTWLETTNVKVQKLSDIGQSAAEPLLNEEGSETMHGTPKS
jgi:hypothetical protein